MKYVLIFSLFLLKFCSNACENIQFNIILSSPDELTQRLNKRGFSEVAEKTQIATKIGCQTKNVFELSQELTQIFEQHKTIIPKSKRAFIMCIVNDLSAIERLQKASLL